MQMVSKHGKQHTHTHTHKHLQSPDLSSRKLMSVMRLMMMCVCVFGLGKAVLVW